MAVFIGIAAVLVGICFFKSDISDIDRTVLLVTSAVSAVFARIAQAGAHHIKLTYLLERRLSRR
jgi:hypothetical protein